MGTSRMVLAATLMAAGTFAFDLSVPLGVAGGALYTILVILGLWSRTPGPILLLAGSATGLTVVGALLSPPGGVLWIGATNRVLTVAAVWAIALLLLHHVRVRADLERVNRDARVVLDVAEFAMVGLDREGRVNLINRRGCQLLGYPEEEILGADWFDRFIPARLREDVRKVHRRVVTGDVAAVEHHENPVLTRDGSERMVVWRNALLRDSGGAIRGSLSSGQDVTESRHLEEKLRRREALARIGQMAAVVAHEVKNPIAGIGGALQILSRRLPEASPEREIIADILERLEGLNRMSQDLLMFARPRTPHPTPVALRDLLRAVGSLLATDPELAGVKVDIEGPEVHLSADRDLIQDLFSNLFLNAAQAMEGKGAIRAILTSNESACQVEIRDDGPGIPPNVRERVFEPFFTTKSRGTGLGLAIARQTVEAHGGMLSLECPPDGGTAVRVELPLELPPRSAPGPAESPAGLTA